MREFVDYGFEFAIGCCLFALGVLVIYVVIHMIKDLVRN